MKMGFFSVISFSKSLPLFLVTLVIATCHCTLDFHPSFRPLQCVHEHFSVLLHVKSSLRFSYCNGEDCHHSKTNLSSWNPGNRDCCTWEGITCDNATGQVTALYLSHLRISGKIDFQILSRIQSLQILNLDDNEFHPSLIPPAVGQLSNLIRLNLSQNYFYGQIPLEMSSLGNLTKLKYLDLSENSLNGIIPSSLFTLPSLRSLVLSGNKLGDQLTEFYNSTSLLLETIDLSENNFQGMISNAIFQLNNLHFLNLRSNNFSGVLYPDILKNSKNLSFLDLGDNALVGSLPNIPPSVKAFLAYNNYLGGEIPVSICNASSLNTLDISDNDFSGRIPKCFGEMSGALVNLDLSKNSLSGNISHIFKEDCSLEQFDVSQNYLGGKLPPSLANCRHLTILNLCNNQLQDAFPSWIHGFADLRIFILSNNKFYGPIQPPPTCQNFSNLQIVDLSFNNFSGSLPPTIFCGWKKMTGESRSRPGYLATKINDFVSYYEQVTIISKGRQVNLTRIFTGDVIVDLSSNHFEAQIPDSIGSLKSLWILNMSHNGFTGPIPLSFKNLTALESLDLSQNDLSGNIPPELSELTFLAVLDLSENQLTGSIPQTNQFLTFTNESFRGNPGLCGPPLSKVCQGTNDATSSSSNEARLFSESEYSWKIIALGFALGYGVGVAVFCWTLVLWTRGRRAYSRFLNRMLQQCNLM